MIRKLGEAPHLECSRRRPPGALGDTTRRLCHDISRIDGVMIQTSSRLAKRTAC